MAWLIYALFAATVLYGAVGLVFISSLVGLGGRHLTGGALRPGASASMQAALTPRRAGSHGRIALLDGLRGLFTLLIVFFHFHMLGGDDRHNHAYLAVDVFFLLLGFVVASAYESRLKSGAGVGWFFSVRMARLYPLYLFGLVLGALLALPFQPAPAVGAAFARGLLFLPGRLPGSTDLYALNLVF